MQLYYYPENLAAKATFWLWELRDLVIIVFGLLLSILALTQNELRFNAAIDSIRFDGVCILDFIRCALSFFLLTPQLFEWRPRYED